ncbi:DUF1819 family protein [Leptospira ognonensis]|nr:DUF1819 family protein [Leptospira ognonensis]
MKYEKYKLSFSVNRVFLNESVSIANLYLKLKDWEEVALEVSKQNLLQTRMQSSSKRLSREILGRLITFDMTELEFLAEASSIDQKYLLWIAICRRYSLIGEFSTEVLREKFLALNLRLTYADFDAFVFAKAVFHPELDFLQETTRKKIRQVLFSLMREVGLLTEKGNIIPAQPSQQFAKFMFGRKANEVMYFPIFESDVKAMVL